MLYRAGRLLDPALDPEGGGADVLKAQVLRSGHGPELADPPGLGGVHELDLGPPPTLVSNTLTSPFSSSSSPKSLSRSGSMRVGRRPADPLLRGPHL